MNYAEKKFVIFGASTGNLGRYVVETITKRRGIAIIPCRGELDESRHLKIVGPPGKVILL